MHKMIVVVTLMAFFTGVSAKNVDLSGTIRGESGDPIEKARITLKNNLSLVAYSDNAGRFRLTGVVSGDPAADSLVVNARGFGAALEKVTEFEKDAIALVLHASNPAMPGQPPRHLGGMVRIIAKDHDFEMGQPVDTVRGLFLGEPTTADEGPVHTVSFTYDFWMDTVEVGQGEYDSLMRLTYGTRYVKPTWNTANGMGPRFPAYAMEWASAALFCNARSKAAGLPDTAYAYASVKGKLGELCTLQNASVTLHANAFRLPTEAEWEYACRAGTASDFYWGKEYKPYPQTSADSIEAGQNAIFSFNSGNLPKNQKVGDSYYGANESARKKPNGYGLYDMAGNVSEWCNDWHDYYAWGAVTDPVGSIPADIANYGHVRRGGNWGNQISYLRAANREFSSPDYQYFFSGFRCVSSGMPTAIGNGKRSTGRRLPQVGFSGHVLRYSDVAGCEIGIYSLSGRTVRKVTATGNMFTMDVNDLPAGTCVVKVRSAIPAHAIIAVVR